MNESQLGDDEDRHQQRTTITSPEDSVKNDKKKKFNIPKIFASKRRGRGGSDDDFASPDCDKISADLEKKIKIASTNKDFLEASSRIRRNFLERRESGGLIEGLNLSNFECSMASVTEIRDFRIFVATWNVGGKTPNSDMNLEDFFLMEGSADIYVCGFQEIVPLNAGNVLVSEDNEPAAKWLALINQALNKPHHSPKHLDSRNDSKTSDTNASKELKSPTNPHIFDKPVLKILSKNFMAGSSLLKTCNCLVESTIGEDRRQKTVQNLANDLDISHLPVASDTSIGELVALSEIFPLCTTEEMNYRLITSKQMVGLFLSIWARKELMPYIGHVRVSSVGRGIMKRLGNKGCIAISMSLHQTSFCFVCCHLASGEKEGDELRRNADVSEILKGTQFPIICKTPNHRAPEKIIEHDRVIWLGDLNYRVALSYEATRNLLEDNNWDTLLENDQLNMEREAGRVFNGFKEGRILFAPTYKYSYNSDSYAGENGKSKKKRRTPAWCDRILWRGSGIEQLSYFRGESRFSDHRPVSALFSVEVIVRRKYDKFRKGYSCGLRRFEYEECIPRRHSFYEC
ncbi:type I inositol polyphosphate 5-phosphatase 5-like [Hibiscus syriacus]|uniref:type I inositol polyphosphate 5-phosphatase 5-like n=1 Tax=Hibiscus syriacus TaxID=106335 RepID=UPI0019224F79|nr:type I inositol polyphosphate 5-phosphatase 5-like [Hibiscus syriacus]